MLDLAHLSFVFHSSPTHAFTKDTYQEVGRSPLLGKEAKLEAVPSSSVSKDTQYLLKEVRPGCTVLFTPEIISFLS